MSCYGIVIITGTARVQLDHRHEETVYLDLSADLRDPQDWKVGDLRTFEFPLDITALAVEPVSGLLAVGTGTGTIFLHGGPAVEARLQLPEGLGVKFLHFAISTSHIVCLDNNNTMHAWDMKCVGTPKYVKSSRFDEVNSMTLSPLHSHIFLAMRSGEVKTYDMACLRKSSYLLPNLWKLYEHEKASSGMPEIFAPAFGTPVEVITHPTSLSLLFVAYDGGVILCDLANQQNILHAYELVLPPGAPGGAGYGMDDILLHRRPIVCSMAIHPSGHILAVGYVDGSLAFWATNYDEKPILVQTLDNIDVNLVSDDLASLLDQEKNSNKNHTVREPIFKLSWSGYPDKSGSSGCTTLAVLGGRETSTNAGLTVVLLPSFNAAIPSLLNDQSTDPATSSSVRDALRESLSKTKCFSYSTRGVIQDFLLIPKDSPHFSNTYDPYAILLLVDVAEGARLIEAYQYPPTGVLTPSKDITSPDIEQDLEALSLRENKPASPILLPGLGHGIRKGDKDLMPQFPLSLSYRCTGLLDGQLISLEKDEHKNLTSISDLKMPQLVLKGGSAWAEEISINEMKLSKYQPRRILVTHHHDFTVRFHDISAQLLLPSISGSIEHDFPEPLPALTIELGPVINDASLSTSIPTMRNASISAVHVASEALECAVVLDIGAVVICLHQPHPSTEDGKSTDVELVHLKRFHIHLENRISPSFVFFAGKGGIESCAISDIGFVAISFKEGSLYIMDLRGPNIMLRPSVGKMQNRKSSSNFPLRQQPHNQSDSVSSLTWTISAVDKDQSTRVRLIAGRISGQLEIYTLSRSENAAWVVNDEPTLSKGVPNPLPQPGFVLDPKTGARWKANRNRLADSFRYSTYNRCFFLTIGTKGARIAVDVNGERIGKVEWGHRYGEARSGQVVERMGHHALAVITEESTAMIYSLPHLEPLHKFQLSYTLFRPLTIDESGDFIVWTSHARSRIIQSAIYGTFFDIRRSYTRPNVDFANVKTHVPPLPQLSWLGPLSALNAWFNFSGSLSGADIDTLLGGPNRPVVRPEVSKNSDKEEVQTSASLSASVSASAAAFQTNVYGRLTSVLGERGQLLGDLEERFNSLEAGSKNMVAQAKKLATQQTAKSWFGL